MEFKVRPGKEKADVVAIKAIRKGEELFTDYGDWYWGGKTPLKLVTSSPGGYVYSRATSAVRPAWGS